MVRNERAALATYPSSARLQTPRSASPARAARTQSRIRARSGSTAS